MKYLFTIMHCTLHFLYTAKAPTRFKRQISLSAKKLTNYAVHLKPRCFQQSRDTDKNRPPF